MRNDDNKTELFAFLADECTKIAVEDGKLVISTFRELTSWTLAKFRRETVMHLAHVKKLTHD